MKIYNDTLCAPVNSFININLQLYKCIIYINKNIMLYYMVLEGLCPPALLYIAFSLTQIIIDIFKKMYNTAFFKLIVTIIFTIALNTLCIQGLGIISWFIVFVPFIMMSIITTLLLFAFGLSPTSGKLNYNVNYPDNNLENDVINNNASMPTNIPVGAPESKLHKIKIIRHKQI